MTRLERIARAANLDPRSARSVRGIPDAALDLMLRLALSGELPAAIVAALPDVAVQDGFRRPRPLLTSDAAAVCAFVREARRRLHTRNRALDADAAGLDVLFDALDPSTEVPA